MMKVLPIVWQRLVTADGETCDRCGNTYLEMVIGLLNFFSFGFVGFSSNIQFEHSGIMIPCGSGHRHFS